MLVKLPELEGGVLILGGTGADCQNLLHKVQYWDSTKGCPRVLDRGQVCVRSGKSLRDLTMT